MSGARDPLQVRSGKPSGRCCRMASLSDQPDLPSQHGRHEPFPPSHARVIVKCFVGYAPEPTGKPRLLRRILFGSVAAKQPLSIAGQDMSRPPGLTPRMNEI